MDLTSPIEEIFLDSTAYFSAIKSKLKSARSSIDIEMYIFIPGHGPGQEVLEILQEKAKQNVQIRVLVDGVGSFEGIGMLKHAFASTPISFRVYNPTFWQQLINQIDTGPLLEKLWYGLQRINSRNHKKVVIIDNQVAFLGSYNLASEHLPLPQGANWADAGIMLQSGAVRLLSGLFENTWNTHRPLLARARFFLQHRRVSLFKDSPIRYNSTHRSRKFYYRDLLHRIRKAQKNITLVTPYLNPPWGFVRALTRAARKGVDVKIITGEKTDIIFYRFLPHIFLDVLSRFGINVHLYQPTVLHAKIVQIDQWHLVGSSNLNYRSFFHDLEIDAVIQKDFSRKQLHHFLLSLEDQSLRFSSSVMLPIWHRMVSLVFYWLRYWL